MKLHERLNAIMTSRLDMSARAILFVLATYLDSDDEERAAWPSTETIGQQAGCSRQTAGAILTRLESLGVVIVTQRAGLGRSTRRVIDWHGLALATSERRAQPSSHRTPERPTTGRSGVQSSDARTSDSRTAVSPSIGPDPTIVTNPVNTQGISPGNQSSARDWLDQLADLESAPRSPPAPTHPPPNLGPGASTAAVGEGPPSLTGALSAMEHEHAPKPADHLNPALRPPRVDDSAAQPEPRPVGGEHACEQPGAAQGQVQVAAPHGGPLEPHEPARVEVSDARTVVLVAGRHVDRGSIDVCVPRSPTVGVRGGEHGDGARVGSFPAPVADEAHPPVRSPQAPPSGGGRSADGPTGPLTDAQAQRLLQERAEALEVPEHLRDDPALPITVRAQRTIARRRWVEEMVNAQAILHAPPDHAPRVDGAGFDAGAQEDAPTDASAGDVHHPAVLQPDVDPAPVASHPLTLVAPDVEPPKPKRSRKAAVAKAAKPPKPPKPPRPAAMTLDACLAPGSLWLRCAELWVHIAGRPVALDPEKTDGLKLARCLSLAPERVLYRLQRVAEARAGRTVEAGAAGVLALETMDGRGDSPAMLLRGILGRADQTNTSCERLDQQREDDLAGTPRATRRPGRGSHRPGSAWDGLDDALAAQQRGRDFIDGDTHGLQ